MVVVGFFSFYCMFDSQRQAFDAEGDSRAVAWLRFGWLAGHTHTRNAFMPDTLVVRLRNLFF